MIKHEVTVAELQEMLSQVSAEAVVSPNALGDLRITLNGAYVGYVDLGTQKRVVFFAR